MPVLQVMMMWPVSILISCDVLIGDCDEDDVLTCEPGGGLHSCCQALADPHSVILPLKLRGDGKGLVQKVRGVGVGERRGV